MSATLKVGHLAPDFKAKAYVNGEFREVALKEYQGKWVCLFFYPLDFTTVCPTEIRSFAQFESKFKELGCQVIGCSTDSEYSHKAWFERDLSEVKYPVLADTAHKISRDYGVLMDERGVALRGTFLIDPKGTLQWMTVNALGTGRSVDEVIRTLEALKTGEACPAGWRPGQPTLK
jgi:alkyl hydroperoxide reductase subunit AhpC